LNLPDLNLLVLCGLSLSIEALKKTLRVYQDSENAALIGPSRNPGAKEVAASLKALSERFSTKLWAFPFSLTLWAATIPPST